MKSYFASESVTEGHPDKVCDQISDTVLDAVMQNDPNGRVACEALATRGFIMVAGEITTNCYVEVPKLVRNLLKNIGYDDPESGFDYQSCGVTTAIQEQSSDIAMGVDAGGAGDQGLMFGFAIDETPELMPLPIMLAHRLVRRLAEIRKNGTLTYLRPDGKSQVAIEYDDGIPRRVETIILGVHHSKGVKTEDLRADIRKLVVNAVVPEEMIDADTKIFINGTGRFEIGGPVSDTGVTGRKIIVDTYGGYARHGGGAFSGKDPTKVDRSASYMARYIAKNIVKAGVARKCEVQLSYCIGVAEPTSVNVNTFGSGQIADEKIAKAIRQVFSLTPRGIIKELDLLRPIYVQTAAYGHFGREEEGFSWEKTDKVNALKKALGSAVQV